MTSKIIYVNDDLDKIIRNSNKSIKATINDFIRSGLNNYENIKIKNGDKEIGFTLDKNLKDKVLELKESTGLSYNVLLQQLILCGIGAKDNDRDLLVKALEDYDNGVRNDELMKVLR